MPQQVLKFWTAALVAAVLFFGFAGCSKPAPDVSVDDDAVLLQSLGRYVWSDDDEQMFGWPGSGTEFAFIGTRAAISIKDGGDGIMDLEVNGVSQALELDAGTHNYLLTESETPQRFQIRLTRRTEASDTGLFSLGVPELEGEFAPLKTRPHKILFLGDSITAGYGVRGDTKECKQSPSKSAPTLAYAGLSAKVLDAEPHLIAISGRGVVHNWDANPAPVMPAQIDFALPDYGDLGDWDHSQFIPDVVVTVLGTNDWSVINPGAEKFRAGYKTMLIDLRERFPKAHIVTVNGPLLYGDSLAAVRSAIDGTMADLGDSNISTLDVTLYGGALKWGCDYHPGRNSMQKMANELSTHISAVKGWAFTPYDLPEPHVITPPSYMLDGGKEHFNSRLPEIDAQPILEGGIILAGDSITEGWLGFDIDLGAPVSNHGIGWDTVTGLKSRLPQMLRHSPDKLFILIGTNDIGYDRGVQQMTDELAEFISGFKRAKPMTEIYIQSVMPREQEALPQVIRINAAYKALAKTMGVNFIDLTPVFAAPDGTLKADLTYDSLHLNEQGYEAWAEVLRPYVRD